MYKAGTKEWDENYAKLMEERKKTESKPYIVSTPEWASEFEKKVQTDDRYKIVAKTWEGSVTLVFKADPEAGLDEDIFILMDLWHGECRSVKIVPSEIGIKGDYVLEAKYQRWKRVMKKELNVVKEMATNKLKLVPFNFKKSGKISGGCPSSNQVGGSVRGSER